MSPRKEPPVIDFSNFTSGDPALQKKCAEEIREACMTQGFFQIINHTIPAEVQEAAFKASETFFGQPIEEKIKLDKSQNAYNRGYEVMSAQRWEGYAQPDFKEGYYVGRDLPADHHQVAQQKFGLGPNVWPENLGPEFRESLMRYLNGCIELAELVVQALAVSLGYDKHQFDDFCKDPMAFYKLLHYPPQRELENGQPKQQAFGAHKDFGIITLLLQGDVPGLQVWDPEIEDWYDVPPVKGAYVVNPGNLLEQWTNDVYISNVHRVIHNSPVDRYTIVFNYNGNPDYIIKCIESCRGQQGEEKYAPISVEDYIKGKYSGVYGRAGIYKVAGQTA